MEKNPSFSAWHKAGNQAFKVKYESDPVFKAKQDVNIRKAVDKATELRPITNPNGCFHGRKHSAEARHRMSEAKKLNPSVNPSTAKPWMHSPELRLSCKVDPSQINSYLASGWIKGRKMYHL